MSLDPRRSAGPARARRATRRTAGRTVSPARPPVAVTSRPTGAATADVTGPPRRSGAAGGGRTDRPAAAGGRRAAVRAAGAERAAPARPARLPAVVLVRTSFQQLDLRQLIRRQTVWIGFDNYRTILTDGEFWAVTVRTLVFAAVCVALTIGARHARRAAHAPGRPEHAAADLGRPAAGLGHSPGQRGHGVQVAVRRAVRRGRLAGHQADPAGLVAALLVRLAAAGVQRDRAVRGLAGDPVRRADPLRRADHGAGRRSWRRPGSTAPAPGGRSGR